ncbi:Sorbitol dehydrogenase [Posidoniimonas corsicana]|uniref:Sorbitol dehydrogenase n=1 Tax=Posidoniimonas corsicana TaxID=1938618 RepID=A0A5C5VAU8_9BACT|nr:galactitol-1-phosphate 5-dehydrogenase [Posidoniimonas corsicana]TWT35130.1 Sorbitol dehydrogenase [Posidoniimonas corsicana]
MKALLLSAEKTLELTDVPEPELAQDAVLIRVAACGICGSDVHGYDGSTGRRIPPLVMGHEAAGVVERVGSAVDGVSPGDRVTFDSTVYCGECDYCRSGRVNLCDNRQVLGVSCGEYRRHGAFAEYVSAPARILYKLPESFPFEHAALIEAVSVAVHAVELAPPQPGQTAVVVGAGMIGLLIVQALRAEGCDQVVAIDVDDDRLKLAKRFGATHAFNAKTADAAAAVRELTGGAGADLALEAVGMTETVRSAVDCVRKGATVVLVGNLSPDIELPLQSVVTREIRVQGSCASAGEYPKSIELMASGAIDVAPLISAVSPLERGPEWFDRLYRREPGLMKVVLTP